LDEEVAVWSMTAAIAASGSQSKKKFGLRRA
jgi:hypothetical protein